jgi:hypothetical protein
MALKNNSDVAYLLTDIMEMILRITSEVYATLKFVNEQIDSHDKEKKKGRIIWNEDQFKLCTIAIDNGIIDTVSMLLALTGTAKEAKLILGSDGSVALEAQTLINAVLTTDTKVATPTLAVQQAKLIMELVGIIPEGVTLARDTSAFVMKSIKTVQGFFTEPEYKPEEL